MIQSDTAQAEAYRDHPVSDDVALPYLYRWDRQGCKGRACKVLARGKMNSCLVEFADGYQMVTSRNAIKKNISQGDRKPKADRSVPG